MNFTREHLPLEYLALRVQHWLIHQHDFLVSTQDIEDAMNEPLPASVCAEPKAYPPSGGEAVAWRVEWNDGIVHLFERKPESQAGKDNCISVTPLYTSPRVVDEAMLDAACEAYSDSYDVDYTNYGYQDNRRACIKAAIQAALGGKP